MVDIHARARFSCAARGPSHDRARAGGKIVNTSSMLAWSGGYIVPAYAAGKAGITAVTKALCNEWSRFGIM